MRGEELGIPSPHVGCRSSLVERVSPHGDARVQWSFCDRFDCWTTQGVLTPVQYQDSVGLPVFFHYRYTCKCMSFQHGQPCVLCELHSGTTGYGCIGEVMDNVFAFAETHGTCTEVFVLGNLDFSTRPRIWQEIGLEAASGSFHILRLAWFDSGHTHVRQSSEEGKN